MSAFVLERLLRASVEGALLAVAVALICRLVPSLPARHRAVLWWLAAAKLVIALAPIRPLDIPVLPLRVAPSGADEGGSIAGTTDATILRIAPLGPRATGAFFPGIAQFLRPRWIAGAWAAGFLALAGSALLGAVRARKLRCTGRPMGDVALARRAEEAARRLGLTRAPALLVVPGLPGPLVAGFFSPSILLPDGAVTRLTAAELEMAIEHELVHVARRDLWLGLIPAAARRIFFFHPVAWWIEREYAVAREAACDEAVVTRGGGDAFTYGQLLLRLAAGRPAATASLSPRSMLRRRLEMIERARNRKPIRARVVWGLLALAAAAFVPMRLVARETPAPEAPPEPKAAATAPAPPTPAAAAPAPRAATVYRRSPAPPAPAPPPPPPPDAPGAPEAPAPPLPADGPEHCLELGHATDTAFVITDGDSHTMCGDVSDLRDAERARGSGDDIIWFRVDGESYVIRDRALVASARDAFRAEHLVGREQSKVGDIQAAIGDKQAAIGDTQARLAESQEKIARELSSVDRNLDLQEKMTELSRRMDELSRQMEILSEQQSELGSRQQALSGTMAEAAFAAQRRLTEILAAAMKSGRAQKAD